MNTNSFHSLDGEGYYFIAEQKIDFDKKNPITASKLIKIFSNWREYSEPHSKNMCNAINILKKSILSDNSQEILDLIT